MTTRRVLAALDASAAARSVLDTAGELARVVDGQVDAVHVRQDRAETPRATAEWAGVALRVLDPPVEEALLAAAAAPDVALVVIGARGSAVGRRPLGRTALRLVGAMGKPVAVVPPEAVGPRPLRRLVVPLEGTEASSGAVFEALGRLVVAPVEVIALHVFTEATLPKMMDRPVRDLEMIGAEFLARNLPGAARVEFRTGAVDRRVIEVCTTEDADLVVLSWSQDISSGRAAVVRGLLGHCRVPVLLLPLAPGLSTASAEGNRSADRAHPGAPA